MSRINPHSITDFLNSFNGGLRPNRFYVTIANGPFTSNNIQFLVRSTTLPASTVTTLNVPYRGRVLKIPGVRTYATWQMTILDDLNSGGDRDANSLYTEFHNWSNSINDHVTNTSTQNNADFQSLFGTIQVEQLGLNGSAGVGRKWELRHAWPSNIGAITLDMDNNDTISTFSVDIEFSVAVPS